jgi:hypothetical protein
VGIASTQCGTQMNASALHKGQFISKGLFGIIISTKNQRIFLRISALAFKKISNQKNLLYNYVKLHLIIDIK